MAAGEDSLLNIPSGSYLLRVDYPDDRSVYLPVLTIAGQRVNIDLNSLPQVPDGFVFVHGGTFRPGSSDVRNIGTRYLPGFFIQKHEVILKDYLEFWRQLKDPELKQLCRGVYRDSGVRGEYMWDENGVLNPLFSEDMPISGISGFAAEEYCRYRTAQTGMLHRLPTQLEWEKAASGVDGRRFVWGNTAVLNAAYTADFPKTEAKKRFAFAPGQFPRDLTVYGAWDMAGNLREMVRNPDDSGSIYRVMGGSCQLGYLQATTSHLGSTNNGVLDAGFRCVIEIPQEADENSL
jgi:serine/threonine-protein kinase